MNSPHPFGALDWTVLAIYASVLLGIGYYFSRKQRTSEEYFLGSRNVNSFLAGISLFAAITSIITYLGTPGEYVQYGPSLSLYAGLLALPFIQIIVGSWLIPKVMRLPITSAYEMLQIPLGRWVRQTGSIVYIVTRFVWMGLILYTSARVLVSVVGCDPHWSYLMIAVIGMITTTYTLIGGIRTVMVTETVQFFVMLLGALLTIVSISVRLGGIAGWIPHHWEPHWPTQPLFSLNPYVRVSLIGAVIYNVIANVCQCGADQATVQRFLTTRDVKTARRAFLLTNLAVGGVSILLVLVGAALLAFYRANPGTLPAHMTAAQNGDLFFPLYISQFLPSGVSGLVVASLMALAMSCLSAGINALVTIVTKDFIEIRGPNPNRTEAQKVRLSRWLALVIGIAVIFGSVAVGSIRGNIMEVAGKTVNLLGCPLFGLFLMALAVKFATPFGAIMGAIYSSASAILIGYWDVLTGGPSVSFLWIAPVSLIVSLGAGCLFSLLPTRGRSGRVLATYTVAALIPLVVTIKWLIGHP